MLDGVNSNNPIDGKHYTMQSLNIKPESRAASIFNEIDMSDGTQDNSLTQEQVNKFKNEYLGKMPEDELKDAVGKEVFKKLSESYLKNFVNEDGTYNLNELSNAVLNALSSDYKMETKNDEMKLIQETLNELTGANFSSKETSKILDLLGFQKQSSNNFWGKLFDL